MPALAYVTTSYVLLPKLKAALTTPVAAREKTEEGGEEAAAKEEHGAKKEEPGAKKEEHGAAKEDPKGEGHGTAKNAYPFGKVLVNVSGSAGTRYLLTQFTLVGGKGDFKGRIDAKKDQLLDLASSTLGTKTIADLEKPGSRNLIRAELISVFNSALGSGTVKEIYFTEFAIQ